MAWPTSFGESNAVLGAPPGMTDEQCGPLVIARVVWHDLPAVVSCWKLTREELDEVNRTGRVWLSVIGTTMPPAAVWGVSPFLESDKKG